MGQLEAELRHALAALTPRLAEAADSVPRAAVAMILAPNETGAAEVLFIRRAEVDGDPWSGHMAFPGGRQSPEDLDLIETALRETREETGLKLRPQSVIGRLDDYRPSSPGLPPIVIAPFVAWLSERGPIEPNHEVAGHVWVPLHVLTNPAHRSSFTLQRGDHSRIFVTIEYEGYTIWGLTFNIVGQFLAALEGSRVLEREGGG